MSSVAENYLYKIRLLYNSYFCLSLSLGTLIALAITIEQSEDCSGFSLKEEKGDIWSRHSFRMLLCYAIPLGGVALLSFLGILGFWGFYALVLLCPLLHYIFMRRVTSKNLYEGSSKNQIDGVGKMKEY